MCVRDLCLPSASLTVSACWHHRCRWLKRRRWSVVAAGRGTYMVLKGCSVKFTTAGLFLKTSGEALQKVLSVCVCVCVAARTCSVHVIYLYWCIILPGHYWDTSAPGHVVLRSAYLKISHFRTQGDLKQNHEILFWKHNVTAFEWYLKMYVA